MKGALIVLTALSQIATVQTETMYGDGRVDLALDPSFIGSQKTVEHLMNSCVRNLLLKVSGTESQIELEVKNDGLDCVTASLKVFSPQRPIATSVRTSSTMISIPIVSHYSEVGTFGCSKEWAFSNKGGQLWMEIDCLIDVVSDAEFSKLMSDALPDIEQGVAIPDDNDISWLAQRKANSGFVEPTVLSDVRSTSSPFDRDVQLIMGHFTWVVLLILGVFIVLLVVCIVITCYFDCQNRTSSLPHNGRKGKPVRAVTPASAHPLLSDDSTQESAASVNRKSLKRKLLIEAHNSVSETSRSRTERKLTELIKHMKPIAPETAQPPANIPVGPETKTDYKAGTEGQTPICKTQPDTDESRTTEPNTAPIVKPMKRSIENDMKTASGMTESETGVDSSDDDPTSTASGTGTSRD